MANPTLDMGQGELRRSLRLDPLREKASGDTEHATEEGHHGEENRRGAEEPGSRVSEWAGYQHVDRERYDPHGPTHCRPETESGDEDQDRHELEDAR